LESCNVDTTRNTCYNSTQKQRYTHNRGGYVLQRSLNTEIYIYVDTEVKIHRPYEIHAKYRNPSQEF